MRSKKVWRYWCDHCSKGGCNKHAMELHEKHCTMNPNRFCRMCDLDSDAQRPMDELIAAYRESLEALKATANGCPACMLAAIRQHKKKYPDPEAPWDDWNYSEARSEYWRERNKNLRRLGGEG